MEYRNYIMKQGIYATLSLNVLLVILAYFVYQHSLVLAAAFAGLMILFDLLTLIAYIPVIGTIISGLLMWLWATPATFTLTELYQTWLVSLIYWFDIGTGILLSIVSLLWLVTR